MTKQIKGVLGTKLGMTQVFADDGKIVPVTVVAAGPCVVTAVRTPDADGYSAVQLGYGEVDPRRVNQPEAGHFARAGVTPRRYLVELRTDDASDYTLGQEVTAETFAPGELVDVTARSKGKGFAGVMKRHGFQRPGRLARHPAQAPGARVHRRLRHPGPGVQGRADGRPDGRRAHDRSQPDPARRGRRPRAAADQGRGSRTVRRAGPGPQRRQDPGRKPVGEPMTATVNVVSPAGSTDATVELPAEIFDAKVNLPLIHQVVVAQQAAARQGTHATKTRGDVRGGGRKPYRQKGTGRARQGSIRAPQFAGGGTVHGPVPRSYEQRTPKKMKAAALRGALSDRAAHGRVHVVSSFIDGDAPRTKDALSVLVGGVRRRAVGRAGTGGRRRRTT